MSFLKNLVNYSPSVNMARSLAVTIATMVLT